MPDQSENKDPQLETTGPDAPLDPVSKSLNDALALSFKLLTLVVVVLLGFVLFRSFFYVQESEVAILTRFGKIVPTGSDNIEYRTAGGPYFAFPAPIDQVTFVPKTVQRLELRTQFVPESQPGDETKTADELMARMSRNLAPGKDGSLITSDKNIVHARFAISFQIAPDNAGLFVRNVGDMNRAMRLVEVVAQEAVLKAVATTNADDFVRATFDVGRAAARVAMQAKLDFMKSGITINEVILTSPSAPMSVRQSFLDVTNAVAEREQRIDQAGQAAEQIQAEAAGTAYRALVIAIDEYERAKRLGLKTGDLTREQMLESVINKLLDGALFKDAARDWVATETNSSVKILLAAVPPDAAVGGQISRAINEAKSYRTQIVQQVESDANRFNQLLQSYNKNPELVRQRIWLEAFQTMLSGDVETFWFSPSEAKDVIIPFKRDATVARARSEAALRAQQAGALQPRSSTPPPGGPGSVMQTAPSTR